MNITAINTAQYNTARIIKCFSEPIHQLRKECSKKSLYLDFLLLVFLLLKRFYIKDYNSILNPLLSCLPVTLQFKDTKTTSIFSGVQPKPAKPEQRE